MRRQFSATWTVTVIAVAALVLTSCGAAENTAAGEDESTVRSATADPTEPESTTSASAQSASVPDARMYHEMVSPTADAGEVLVFGGQTFHGWDLDVGDLWAYEPDTDRWEQRREPLAGEVTAAAYDAESDRVVVVDLDGGTFSYDAATDEWERMQPADAPSPRCGQTMAYDTESDRVVLFAGFACTKVTDPMLDDTWTYDLNSDSWKQMNPETSPPARIFHGTAYDPGADRVVVWGGRVEDDRVWTYDVNNDRWEPHRPVDGPTGIRAYHGVAYDPVGERVLVFGGLDLLSPLSTAGEMLDELWAYDVDEGRWTRVTVENPPAGRSHHAMVFAPAIGRHVVFGGETGSPYSNNVTDEIWLFDPATDTWSDTSAE